MATVSVADGGDVAAVRTGGEPVEHLRPDRAAPLAPVGMFHRAGLARHQQHQPRTHRLGLGEPMIEPGVGAIEREAVKVEGEIWIERGGA
jgi:hypothetical protein